MGRKVEGNVEHAATSPTFQVVIPKAIREALALHPGQRMAMIAKGRAIVMVPALPVESLRGIARGV
jgi:AbrB family looped-hinge helix DNA binding protein